MHVTGDVEHLVSDLHGPTIGDTRICANWYIMNAQVSEAAAVRNPFEAARRNEWVQPSLLGEQQAAPQPGGESTPASLRALFGGKDTHLQVRLPPGKSPGIAPSRFA